MWEDDKLNSNVHRRLLELAEGEYEHKTELNLSESHLIFGFIFWF